MRKTLIPLTVLTVVVLLSYGCARMVDQSPSDSADKIEPVIETTSEMNEKELTFAYTLPAEHQLSKFLTMVYTEAFSRLGYAFKIEIMPPERASEAANNGLVDGEVNRLRDYNETYTNLVLVEEPHMVIRFAAFSTDATMHFEGWESFKDTAYSVEYRQGIQRCEVMLPLYVHPKNLVVANSIETGIQHLIEEKTDIYVDVENSVKGYLSSGMINGDENVQSVGVMEQSTGHLFLHKRHSELADKLSEVLKDMKAEGLFEQYLDKLGLSQYDIQTK